MHLILSPHSDDAVFSLGGLLHAHAAKQDFGVVTIFTQSRYTITGDGEVGQVSGMRAVEDKNALAEVGIVPEYLDLPDSGMRYESEAVYMDPSLQATNDPLWPALRQSLDQVVARYPHAVIWVPLAIGSHIDHRMVSAYGARLAQEGRPIVFYEDAGYEAALVDSAVAARCAQIDASMQPHTFGVSLEAKLRLAGLYLSQVDTGMVACISAHFRKNGGERVWANPATIKQLAN